MKMLWIRSPATQLFYQYGPVVLLLTVCYAHTLGTYEVNLREAIDIALQKNRLRIISAQETAIAKAQYRQALTSYWPDIALPVSLEGNDDSPGLIFPSRQINLPRLPPTLPEGEEILFDRDVAYPLRSNLIKRAKINTQIAYQATRQTGLHIIHDVKRHYYTVRLTRVLQAITEDSVPALETTRDITQTCYEDGPALATKRDFLQIELNQQSTYSALSHTMNLSCHGARTLKSSALPEPRTPPDLDQSPELATRFNPETKTLILGIAANKAEIGLAHSDYFPSIGIAANMALFNGLKTKDKLTQARLQHQPIKGHHRLPKQSIALQIKTILLKIRRAIDQIEIAKRSILPAKEGSSLTRNGYQNGALKTEGLSQSLLLASLIQGKPIKFQHGLALALTQLAVYVS